jgi:hypothetical protein
MIVSEDEFYIPAFCFEMECKGNPIFLGKEFFLPGMPKFINEKPSAKTNLQRALCERISVLSNHF